jgi:hypothetical protein
VVKPKRTCEKENSGEDKQAEDGTVKKVTHDGCCLAFIFRSVEFMEGPELFGPVKIPGA